VVPNVCGSSEWRLLNVTHLALKNFEVTSKFLENLCTHGLTTAHRRGRERKSQRRTIKEEVLTEGKTWTSRK